MVRDNHKFGVSWFHATATNSGEKSKMRVAKFSKWFLFLEIGFLMLFSPFSGQAQSVSERCELVSEWVNELVNEEYYNGSVDRYESRLVVKPVLKLVEKCVPISAETNSTTPSSGNSSHPNTVRNADGTLRAANGYRWVNPKDPDDFSVELLPGLISTENGKLGPASGYQWVNGDDPDDFRVELMPGLLETEKGKFNPAKGYRWVNPDDPKDFRVERIP